MDAKLSGSGVRRPGPAAGASARLILVLLVLYSTPIYSQTIEKAIPLDVVGSEMEVPRFLAVDSTTQTVYVADAEDCNLLAIDAVRHRRKANITWPNEQYCISLLTLPGHDRLVYIGDDTATVIDTRGATVLSTIPLPPPQSFLGGGANPGVVKFYLGFSNSDTAADEGMLVLDAVTGAVLSRIPVGLPETDPSYDRMFFACNTANNKVYVFAYQEETDDDRLVVVSGTGDSIRARLRMARSHYEPTSLSYDCRSNLVWSTVGTRDSTFLVAVDGTTDTIVASYATPRGLFVTDACLAVEDNRLYLADEDASRVCVFDLVNRRFLDELRPGDIATTMAVNTRGHRLYVGTWERGVAIYDTRDGAWKGQVGSCFYEPYPLAFCGGANDLWCAAADTGMVFAVDGTADTLCAAISVYSKPFDICLDRSTGRVYVTGLDSRRISVVDTRLGVMADPIEVPFEPGLMCVSQTEGKLFCASTCGQKLMITDLVSRSSEQLEVDCPLAMVFDSARNVVYAVSGEGRSVSVIAGDGSNIQNRITLTYHPRQAYFDPANRRLWCCLSRDYGIDVVDCDRDSVIHISGIKPNGLFLSGIPAQDRVYCRIMDSIAVFDARTLRRLSNLCSSGDYSGDYFCYSSLSGRAFFGGWDDSLTVVELATDSVVGKASTGSVLDCSGEGILGYMEASNSVYWLDESGVHLTDARTLEPAGFTAMKDLWPYVLCDGSQSRLYLIGYSNAYVVHNEDPKYHVQSRTGPVLTGRDVFLYGRIDAQLVDVAGRRLQTLRPGSNRLTSLAPGTYFILRLGTTKAQKVIITK